MYENKISGYLFNYKPKLYVIFCIPILDHNYKWNNCGAMLAIGWILNYLWYKQSMNKGFNLSRNIQSQNGEIKCIGLAS